MSDVSILVLQGLQIIWINVLLSGDNAVVIALACRGLEPAKRKWGILAGSLAAVGLRIVFTIFVVELLRLPFLKIVSGVLLFGIALRLLTQDTHNRTVAESSSIWGAVQTIAIADAVMSLDNVVAVAAAAKNSVPLIVFGIVISVPLIVFGATLVLRLLNRFPLLIVAGAALLGWVAGGIIATDPKLTEWIDVSPEKAEVWASTAGAALILAVAGAMRAMRPRAVSG